MGKFTVGGYVNSLKSRVNKSLVLAIGESGPLPRDIRKGHAVVESLIWLSVAVFGSALSFSVGSGLLAALPGPTFSSFFCVALFVLSCKYRRNVGEGEGGGEDPKMGHLKILCAQSILLGYALGGGSGSATLYSSFVFPLTFGLYLGYDRLRTASQTRHRLTFLAAASGAAIVLFLFANQQRNNFPFSSYHKEIPYDIASALVLTLATIGTLQLLVWESSGKEVRVESVPECALLFLLINTIYSIDHQF